MESIDLSSLPSLFSSIPHTSHPPLLNLLHHLHTSLLSTRQSLHSLSTTHSALLTSHTSLHSQYVDLSDSHTHLDKKLCEMDSRSRLLQTDCAQREKAVRAQVAEVEKRAVMVQHRDKQYRHELKKREVEHDKMAERMLKLLQERGGRDKGMGEKDAINDAHRGERGRGRREGDLTARLLQREEERRAEVQLENAALKAYLLTLEGQLDALLPSPVREEGGEVGLSPSKKRTEQSVLTLPWKLVERSVHQRLTQRLQAIARHSPSTLRTGGSPARSTPSTPPPPPRVCTDCQRKSQQVEALQLQLQSHAQVLSSQDALLVSRLFSGPPIPLSPGTRRLSLDEDLAELVEAHQRSQAVLDEQRAELQVEREEWEERQRRGGRAGDGWLGVDELWTPMSERVGLRIECSPSPSPPSSPFDWDDEREAEGVLT